MRNVLLELLLGKEKKVWHLLLLRAGCVSRPQPNSVIYAAVKLILIFFLCNKLAERSFKDITSPLFMAFFQHISSKVLGNFT